MEYEEQSTETVEDLGQIIQQLLEFTQIQNLCDYISDDELLKLGRKVVEDAELDESSREDWMKRSEKAMDMALQVVDTKTFPWENASNVKTPLLTEAALQFHARCYPAIIQGDQIVKGKVTGEDPQSLKIDRADRVASHMNYQIMFEMPEWEEDVDRMLLALPIEGCEFKKIYFDPVKGRNVSEWIRPGKFIVNNHTRSLDDCPRATHEIEKYPHQIAELQAAGVYCDVDLNISSDDDEQEKPQCLYEQYRLIDLDEDGVKEPYIVLVHKESGKVLRIKSNWEPDGIVVSDGQMTFKAFVRQGVQLMPNPQLQMAQKLVKVEKYQYFVKHSFLPSPDGSFYDVGYGQLVTPLIESIDTIINQIIDAGTLANCPGGLITEGLKILNQASGSGEIRWEPGEYKKAKLGSSMKIADSIYQFQFPGPSTVLFSMLGSLIEQVKVITSTSDIMTGATAGSNEPVGTTLARLDQSMKVFNAVYKRVYRSFGKEFKLLYKLNSIYLQPQQYFQVIDSQQPIEILIEDYQGDDTDIQPISDPSVATTQQRLAKAQFLMQIQVPNQQEALTRILEAGDIDGIEQLMQAPQPAPDPKMIEIMAKVEKMSAETEKVAAETQKIHADIAQAFEELDLEKFKTAMEAMERMDEQIRTGNVVPAAGVEMVAGPTTGNEVELSAGLMPGPE